MDFNASQNLFQLLLFFSIHCSYHSFCSFIYISKEKHILEFAFNLFFFLEIVHRDNTFFWFKNKNLLNNYRLFIAFWFN